MDPIELSRVRERTRSIQFALKYDQRRSSSAFSKRSSFFTQMSAIDRRNNANRTNSVVEAAQQAQNDVWQLVRCMLPVRKLMCAINKHVVID